MKKFFALALATLMLASSLAFAPRPAQAQGPGLLSAILNKMERNRRDLHTLRSAITMQKYNAQLKDYDMSTGEVAYIAGAGRNANVRVDWQKPTVELLSVLDGKYTLYRPRLNQALVGTTAAIGNKGKVNSVLGFGLNASSAQLRGQYDIDVVGEGQLYDGGPKVWMLKLTPKTASAKLTEVWVDQSTGMPVQTRVTEKNGDSTLVRLTNIQRNAPVKTDDIKIELPAGVKIVKG